MKKIIVFSIFWSQLLTAQVPQKTNSYTLADTLRGSISPLRSCYDINFYHLTLKINPQEQSIQGQNVFKFTATQDFKKLQFDLFANLSVDSVCFQEQKLPFSRKFNAVFVDFPQQILKNTQTQFTVFYHGNPNVAKRAPWDGGFIFTKDKNGNDWISVACQGLGASVWWPNKDHQSDEVDSMEISIISPSHLQEISNGRLMDTLQLGDGYTLHNWKVSSPINNYDVAFYIGKYQHFTDTYQGLKGALSIDYWALAQDAAQAFPHWQADVKPMLQSFEYWFGAYPFYQDGYKLVQAPYLGMEHQSAVAYGNRFMQGYMGRDLSGTGWGLKWDFITVHESGHEWFGNNITSKDIADMWVHESFTNYSEVLFLDHQFGTAAGNAYLIGLRKNIQNDVPIIGDFGVNKEGSGDMYYKGANMIHIIRQIIHNDSKFRKILTGLNQTFYHQTITGQQIEDYISKQSGIQFDKVFEQYLTQTTIPKLMYKIEKNKISYYWTNCVSGFDMPVKVTIAAGKYSFIYPKEGQQNIKSSKISHIGKNNFKIDENFYIESQQL